MNCILAVLSLLTVYGYVAAGPVAERPEARATNAYIFLDITTDLGNPLGYFKSCTDKLNKAQYNEFWNTSYSTKWKIQRYTWLISQFRFYVATINTAYSSNFQIFANPTIQSSIEELIKILVEVKTISNEYKLTNANAVASSINASIIGMRTFKGKVSSYNSMIRFLYQDLSASDVNAFITVLYSGASAISQSASQFTVTINNEDFGFFAFSFDFAMATTNTVRDAAKSSLRQVYATLASASTSAQTVIVNTYYAGCKAIASAVQVYVSSVSSTATISISATIQSSALVISESTVENVLVPVVDRIKQSFEAVKIFLTGEFEIVQADMQQESTEIKADLNAASNECQSLSDQIISRIGGSLIAPTCAAWYLPQITAQLSINQAAIAKCQLQAQSDFKVDTDKIKALIQDAYLKISANLTSCVDTCASSEKQITSTVPASTSGVDSTTPSVTSSPASTTSPVMTSTPLASTTSMASTTGIESTTASEEEKTLQTCIDAKVDIEFVGLRAAIKAITKELKKGGKRRQAIISCRSNAKSSRASALASIKTGFISCAGIAAF